MQNYRYFTLGFICALAFLLILPTILVSLYIVRVLVFAHVFAILAACWDLLGGYTGQISFGNALFFGTGVYITAFLTKGYGISPWICLPVGAISAFFIAAGLGTVCLRLSGAYLSLVTLSISLAMVEITHIFWWYTGAEEGIRNLPPLVNDLIMNYYISVVLLGVTFLTLYFITRSSIGLTLVSIREDSVAAESVGVDTTFYKILAFSISGFFTGLVGSFYASFIRVALPSTFSTVLSTNMVLWSVLGGLGTITGPAVVAYTLTIIGEVFRIAEELRVLLTGLLAVVVLLFYPKGVIRIIYDVFKRVIGWRVRSVHVRST
jgi:branched-chain amino acid transport system permease protein